MTIPKVAFATLLTKESYLAGVLVLHHSLQAVNSRHELVVMVTPTLSQRARRLLQRTNLRIKEIERLLPEQNRHTVDSPDARFADTWTKLRAFELTEYNRIALLDADMVILRNMDDLLELELPGTDWIAACHVCTCNPRQLPHYPSDWKPENCAYTPLETIGNSPPPPLAIESHRTHGLLNSGTVLLHPSPEITQEIYNYLSTSPEISKFAFPDQDLLANVFKGRWKPLPYVYNALKTLRLIHQRLWKDEHVRIVHYILHDKPWMVPPGTGGDYEEMYSWWWKHYDEIIDELRESDPEACSLVESQVKREHNV
ncbi:glycosyltransferase family 8 protein [Sphaerobolus stellatus SS14]|uniref:Glycosyltransferase family 8 protein n=1 Tax=Sphaerobolus stellatus (strain SS14) TaxID=990650 RepID=A0A0C9VF43_SPHS4|nr:glycosyltransferase family 8 protein [Sphaerobolus stellatus SS14]